MLRRNADAGALHARFGLTAHPVPPTLEDGFMLLLRERQKEAAQAHGPAEEDGRAAVQGTLPGSPARGSGAPGSTAFSRHVGASVQDGQQAAPADNAAGATDGAAGDVVIEVRDLVKRFGSFTAVDSTSFCVRRGEIFGLLGPNGAGKTTTFRMLCGLLPATSGLLRVAGNDLRTARAQARANIGYVAQKFSLYGTLTVEENLQFFGGIYNLHGRRLRERIATVRRQFDLREENGLPCNAMPGGFRQRLAMAAGLLHEPQILFLDEPTSGIDALARRAFWRQITELAAGSTTIIITTHFMEEAEYCDRMVIQDAGKILALGTPGDVRRQAGPDVNSMEEAFIRIVERHRAARAGAEQ
ncbi:MAG TPA: ABC transporter ATP-binding protein [Candidatus Avidesulfovibrio excrementigallinarum]|nr:ABC transporter ATP-binding protein [Candidatus Avidesulfovibrio excrementigallinarum]